MILLGLVAGACFALLPGLGLSTILALVITGLSANPLDGAVFIVSAEATESLFSRVGILQPVAMIDPRLMEGSARLIKKGKGLTAVAAAGHAFTLGKVGALVVLIAMTLGDTNAAWSMIKPLIGPLSLCIAVGLWWNMILQSKYRLAAIGVLALALYIGYSTVRMQVEISVLTMGMYGLPAGALLLQQNTMPAQMPADYQGSPIQGSSIATGIVSTLLMGLPVSALLAWWSQSRDDLDYIVQANLAGGISSGLSIGLALLVGSNRSAVSGYLQMLGGGYSNLSIAGLLILSLVITLGGHQLLGRAATAYSHILHYRSLIGLLVLLGMLGFMLLRSGMACVPLLIGGAILQVLINQAGIPRAASLAALGGIPILGYLQLM